MASEAEISAIIQRARERSRKKLEAPSPGDVFAGDVESAAREDFVTRAVPEDRLRDIDNVELLQGGEGTFVERLKASFKFNKAGVVDMLKKARGGDDVVAVTGDDGEVTKILVLDRETNVFRPFDPTRGGGLGEFAKDVIADAASMIFQMGSEAGGAVAGAKLGLVGGGLPGALAGAAGGALLGNVGKQAIGAGIEGEESVDLFDRGLETAIDTTLAPAPDVVAAGVKPVGRVLRKTLGTRAGATKTRAREFLEPVLKDIHAPSPYGAKGETFATQVKKTESLEDRLNARIADTGESIAFSPGQATGSGELLLAERTTAQTPGFIDPFLVSKGSQARAFAAATERAVKDLASDPSKLGSSDLVRRTANTGRSYIRSLRAERAKEAGALFKEVDRISRGRRSIDLPRTRAMIQEQISRYRGARAPTAKKLAKDLDALGEGPLTASAVQDFLADLQTRISDPQSFQAAVPGADDTYALAVKEALEADLDAAVMSKRPGARKLAEARQKWAELSKPIQEAGDGILKKIIDLDAKGNPDQLVRKINSMSDDQAKGLMEILDKTDKGLANDVRAFYLKDLFSESGAMKDKILSEDVSLVDLSLPKLSNSLKKNRGKIRALYGKDPAADQMVSDLISATERLKRHPSITGSDTMPKLLKVLEKRFGSMSNLIQEAVTEGWIAKDAVPSLMTTRGGFRDLTGTLIAVALPDNKFKAVAKKYGPMVARTLLRLSGYKGREATKEAVLNKDVVPGLVQEPLSGGRRTVIE